MSKELTMSNLPIGPETRVTLHFSLKFEDGAVIDSNFDKDPAVLVVGDSSLPTGFEQKIIAMKAGERGVFTLLPEESFGQSNPNNVQLFSRADFDKDIELVEGLVISFADSRQSELPGVIKSIESENIYVDFNHPLAGQNIVFEVEIVNVEAEN